jgi:hypothetical protein
VSKLGGWFLGWLFTKHFKISPYLHKQNENFFQTLVAVGAMAPTDLHVALLLLYVGCNLNDSIKDQNQYFFNSQEYKKKQAW